MDGLKTISDFFLNDFSKKKIIFVLISKTYPYFFLKFLKNFLEKFDLKLLSFENEKNDFFKNQIFFSDSFDSGKKIFFYNFLENKENNEIDYNFSSVVLTTEDFFKKNENNEILKLDFNVFLDIDSLNFFNKFLEKREKIYAELVFKKFKKLKIEKFFTLLNYSTFLKEKSWEEISNYFEEEIEKEKYSLFDIATFFFKKNKEEFYFLWNLIKNDYEIEFWNFYWLKQFWQAYKFLSLDFDQKTKYNLPFWFIKNGKKTYKKIQFLNILKNFYIEISFFREKNFDINSEIIPCEKIFLYWFF